MVSGGDLDKSPMACRRLPEVLEHDAATVQVLRHLPPCAVAMAGVDETDRFKD